MLSLKYNNNSLIASKDENILSKDPGVSQLRTVNGCNKIVDINPIEDNEDKKSIRKSIFWDTECKMEQLANENADRKVTFQLANKPDENISNKNLIFFSHSDEVLGRSENAGTKLGSFLPGEVVELEKIKQTVPWVKRKSVLSKVVERKPLV